MPLYGLIGYPLLHSASRPYFLEKFRREQITDCDYQVFPLASITELPALIQAHPQLVGLSVTIPYKETVLPYANACDEVVQACGATNSLRIRNGHITAFNTDAIGFEQSLIPLLTTAHRKACILGTGGAAKAVAFVLQKLGIDYVFVSRSSGNKAHTITYAGMHTALLRERLLIINASPAGMLPAADTFPPIDYTALTPQHLLYDLVYKPEKTLFLQYGEENGAVTKNGYEMLVLQAEASWKIWNS